MGEKDKGNPKIAHAFNLHYKNNYLSQEFKKEGGYNE